MYPIYVHPFFWSLWEHTPRKLYPMSHRYETSLGIFHAKPFDNGFYVPGVGQAKHPFGSISIDPNPQDIGCFP